MKQGVYLDVPRAGFVISNPFSSKLLTASRNRLHEGRHDPVLKDLVRQGFESELWAPRGFGFMRNGNDSLMSWRVGKQPHEGDPLRTRTSNHRRTVWERRRNSPTRSQQEVPNGSFRPTPPENSRRWCNRLYNPAGRGGFDPSREGDSARSQLLPDHPPAELSIPGLHPRFFVRPRLDKVWDDPVLVHLVNDHRQVVSDELTQDLVHLSHRVPRPDVLSELPLER